MQIAKFKMQNVRRSKRKLNINYCFLAVTTDLAIILASSSAS
jgi:hypothetical protein